MFDGETMANKTEEKYGGIFVYEISFGTEKRYTAANPDSVRDILNSWGSQVEDRDKLGNADEIHIRRMGKLAIEGLTLDRLVAEANLVK